MSLINYVEPVSIGSALVGLGSLITMIALIYMFWRFFNPMIKYVEQFYNHQLKFDVVEEKMLDEIAKEKGIDLDGELLKRKVLETPRKNFRRKIEDEIFDKMFPEKTDKK